MTLDWRQALTVAAVIFLLFLLAKLRPSGRGGDAGVSEGVRDARLRAQAATTPRERAEALADAGSIAAKRGRRWTAAAGYFLRAMRADPAWVGAIEQARAALGPRRPRLLEKVLWRRLAALSWEAGERDAARAAAEGLAALYAKPLRDHVKADVMAKLAKKVAGPGDAAAEPPAPVTPAAG